LFQHGEPLNYVALQNLYDGRPAGGQMTVAQPVTGRYQLLMGPWYHLTAGNGLNLDRLELEWFDTWLKHEPTGMAETTTPLHLNVLGTTRYVDLSRWPADGAQASTLWLGPGGTMSTSEPTAPAGNDPIAFTGLSAPCDRETSQWMMGADNVVSGAAGLGADPCTNADNDIQAGPAALTFTTAPMAADTVVAGPMNLSLAATDTATEAEWIANVEDVTPSGQSVPLTSGALLGSMRTLDVTRSWVGPGGRLLLPWHSYSAPSAQPVVAGTVTRYEVEIFPTLAEIPKGDSLRVTISTSDTPHLLPTPRQLANLAGGIYAVELNATAPSYLEAVLLPASHLASQCTLCAQAAG
jgi:putative CocE/NonD family hydrolase